VLALPRGGVPVALEVAQALKAPLDLVLVRKIGAPMQPELAVAAVVDGATPHLAVNEEIRRLCGVDDAYLEAEKTRQLAEIERRRALYLGGRAPRPVAGRTAIVVDDGIATGATMRAALLGVRAAGPRQVVMAVPVAPAEAIEELAPLTDETVCLQTPSPFGAVGMFYANFRQIADEEVVEILKRADAPEAETKG
jgi:putative phosphoribosyl transferase